MEVQKIDVESLIRLKRNEMPNEAFWDEFDHQLQLRLANEMVVAKDTVWNRLSYWIRRFVPLASGCALAVLLIISFVKPSGMSRYVVLSNPASVEECSRSVLTSSFYEDGVPMKSVIQKKMIASNVANCFSF